MRDPILFVFFYGWRRAKMQRSWDAPTGFGVTPLAFRMKTRPCKRRTGTGTGRLDTPVNAHGIEGGAACSTTHPWPMKTIRPASNTRGAFTQTRVVVKPSRECNPARAGNRREAERAALHGRQAGDTGSKPQNATGKKTTSPCFLGQLI